jgi:CPA2 family monovalent cation:H+ antiporter-2
VIAWTRAGVTQTSPSEKTQLMAGDIVVLLGSRAQIQQAMELFVPTGTN